MQIVDANIVLRYLLKVNEILFQKAKNILEQQNIFIPYEIVAEIIYVLEKVYKIAKTEIRSAMNKLIDYNNISFLNKELVRKSIEYYSIYNLDYADSLLCAYKNVEDYEVITFDEKILKTLNKI